MLLKKTNKRTKLKYVTAEENSELEMFTVLTATSEVTDLYKVCKHWPFPFSMKMHGKSLKGWRKLTLYLQLSIVSSSTNSPSGIAISHFTCVVITRCQLARCLNQKPTS